MFATIIRNWNEMSTVRKIRRVISISLIIFGLWALTPYLYNREVNEEFPVVALAAATTMPATGVPTAMSVASAPTAVPTTTTVPTANVPTATLVPTVAAPPTTAPDNVVPTVAAPPPVATTNAAPTAVAVAPTKAVQPAPTAAPTAVPTVAPTREPTVAPTVVPTAEPTAVPTDAPTAAPVGPVALATGRLIPGSTPGDHAEGTATIYRLEDGRLILRLQDFETTNGPDLFVTLSTSANPDNDAGEYLRLAPLKGNKGNQNYDLPADIDLGAYKSAVIWCRAFNIVFGYAPLQST